MADTRDITTLLILGAGGDLTHRLLLPGIGSLLRAEPTRKLEVIGVGLEPMPDKKWKSIVESAFDEAQTPARPRRSVLARTKFLQADVTDVDQLRSLIESRSAPLVIYFALPPAVSITVCDRLAEISLPNPTRLALEKPFGNDEKSARTLDDKLHRLVPEEQVFRVDHFLGTATVLNLIGLRFANRVMRPIWNAEYIDRVEIVYDEDLALEGRAGYYDHAGALVDMLQSHLLQVMAVFAMEPVASLSARDTQDGRGQVLRCTRLWGNSPTRSSKRARYTSGSIGRRKVPSYVKEKGVDPSRNTETLAQITVEVANQRWAGVPFTLRSGKALGAPRKQILVWFKPVEHLPTGFVGPNEPDRLIIDLKPAAVSLELTMNAEGDPFDLEQKTLSADLAEGEMLAYGQVLGEVLDGDQRLSVRGDAAEDCWRIVDPVLRAWRANKVPLQEYPAGSNGPDDWNTA